MGVTYEMNWYLVVSDKNELSKVNEKIYKTIKKERRLYPINSELPIIIKNLGCIGIVKILCFKIYEDKTEIEFEYVEEFETCNDISQHYYNMYKLMKKS